MMLKFSGFHFLIDTYEWFKFQANLRQGLHFSKKLDELIWNYPLSLFEPNQCSDLKIRNFHEVKENQQVEV